MVQARRRCSTVRAVLVVHPISRCQEVNLNLIVQSIHEATDAGADLVLFGETALIGFMFNSKSR